MAERANNCMAGRNRKLRIAEERALLCCCMWTGDTFAFKIVLSAVTIQSILKMFTVYLHLCIFYVVKCHPVAIQAPKHILTPGVNGANVLTSTVVLSVRADLRCTQTLLLLSCFFGLVLLTCSCFVTLNVSCVNQQSVWYLLVIVWEVKILKT